MTINKGNTQMDKSRKHKIRTSKRIYIFGCSTYKDGSCDAIENLEASSVFTKLNKVWKNLQKQSYVMFSFYRCFCMDQNVGPSEKKMNIEYL